MSPDSDEVVDLLRAWNLGDQEALEKVIPLVDRELESLARSYLRREQPGHDLEAADLINEALIRLIEEPKIDWQSRRQFFAIAGRRMRQILVEHARKHSRSKRENRPSQVSLSEAVMLPTTEIRMVELLELDEALAKLAKVDERKSEVMELRYFAGLTSKEIAAVLNISWATVEREWRVARAWLQQELVVGITPALPDVSTTTKKSEMASSVTVESERKLAEAWSNRELIATLMSHNWAGLKLLVHLRTRPNVTEPELGSPSGVNATVVKSLLLKLREFGVLENRDDVCAINKRGYSLLRNFETATGSTFD